MQIEVKNTPTKKSSKVAAVHFLVGKRSVVLIRESSRSGFLVNLTGIDQALKLQTSYLRKLEDGIDCLPEAFVLYDDKDRLLISNSRYAELYPSIAPHLRPGITFGEIAQLAVSGGQFIFDDGPDEWLRRRLDFHRRGEGYFEQHLNDGRWIQLSERRTRSGGITSIRTDVTLLKEREDTLRKTMLKAELTSRSMARFLAVFSHETRNGLNGVAGIAQMLAAEGSTDNERDRAESLLQLTRRQTAVLNDLLDFLKNEATGVSLQLVPMDPRQLLKAIYAEFSSKASLRRLSLVLEVGSQVPALVLGDPGRIQQVMSNLVSNAVKYSLQGTISIRLSLEKYKLRYEVSDQGIGIEEDDLKEIFEDFVRADPGNPNSTGLGLAISKQLITAMGGEICVESVPGNGSRFWFDLPLGVTRPPSHRKLRETRSDRKVVHVSQGGALSVGVMDDEPLNTAVAESLLRQLGHNPFVFENCDQLLDHVATYGLDVVLLDLMMPDESGFEIALRLRLASGSFGVVPFIIALTGNVLPDSLTACKAAGIDAILQKPLFLDQLQNSLDLLTSSDRIVNETLSGVIVSEGTGPDHGSRFQDVDEDAHHTLARLRNDIGEDNLRKSLEKAKRTITKLLTLGDLDSTTFRTLLHQVGGSASLLGFARLGDAARRLESLLAQPMKKTKSKALHLARAEVDHLAKASLAEMERALLPPRPNDTRSGG